MARLLISHIRFPRPAMPRSTIRSLTTLRRISAISPRSSSHPTAIRHDAPSHQQLRHRSGPAKPPPIRLGKPTPPKKDSIPPQPPQQQPKSKKGKKSRWVTIALLAALLVAFPPIRALTTTPSSSEDSSPSASSTSPSSTPTRGALNPTTFAPFTITAREQLSPTAFILTLTPSNSSSAAAVRETAKTVRAAWRRGGLWSVEVKQPELQVARDYTPLPLPPSAKGEGVGGDGVMVGDGDGKGEADGEIRLYVRRLARGEVSNYLARLGVGDTVELRGPRLGFDLRARAGVVGGGNGDGADDGRGVQEGQRQRRRRKVVFLAGGTGIAPALQAAAALLEAPELEMEIVWANRRREDCVGCSGDGKGQKQGAVVALLEEYRRRYGGRFRYTCTVDEEASFIDAGAIVRSVGVAPPSRTGFGRGWGLWANASQDSSVASPPTTSLNSDACHYHSAKRLISSDDRDPPAAAGAEACQCKDADGNRVAGGKNLLLFSGPDGFIEHFAGEKVWGVGKELQGPVKGVIADLKRKYPSIGDDWLVLKS